MMWFYRSAVQCISVTALVPGWLALARLTPLGLVKGAFILATAPTNNNNNFPTANYYTQLNPACLALVFSLRKLPLFCLHTCFAPFSGLSLNVACQLSMVGTGREAREREGVVQTTHQNSPFVQVPV
jgi:hypothetical protein